MSCPECGHITLSGWETIEDVMDTITGVGDTSLRIVVDNLREQSIGIVQATAEEVFRAFKRAGADIECLWVGDSIDHLGCHELIFWGPKLSKPSSLAGLQEAIAVALLEAQYRMCASPEPAWSS